MVKEVINIILGEYTLKIILNVELTEGSFRFCRLNVYTPNNLIMTKGVIILEAFQGLVREIFSLEASLDT